MGATYPEAMAEIRAASPNAWFLVPGVGAQGGELEAVLRAGLRADGMGLLINASRSILLTPMIPAQPRATLHAQIRDARAQATLARAATRNARAQEVATSWRGPSFEADCVRFGDFVLHSGSPLAGLCRPAPPGHHPANVLERWWPAAYADLLALSL
jgi:uridine monophosphate synthetase